MEQRENINLEEISIKDIGIFNGIDSKFAKFFKKYNLSTVKSIVEFDDDELNKTNLSIQTKNELRGLFELIRYKYLGEPLIADEYLNELFSYVPPAVNEELIRMGFTNSERTLIYGPLRNGSCREKNLTYFELLENFDTRSPYLKEKIRLYLESYKIKKEQGLWDNILDERYLLQTIKNLSTELQFLTEKRDYLNLQISEIQDKIKELENEMSRRRSTR